MRQSQRKLLSQYLLDLADVEIHTGLYMVDHHHGQCFGASDATRPQLVDHHAGISGGNYVWLDCQDDFVARFDQDVERRMEIRSNIKNDQGSQLGKPLKDGLILADSRHTFNVVCVVRGQEQEDAVRG